MRDSKLVRTMVVCTTVCFVSFCSVFNSSAETHSLKSTGVIKVGSTVLFDKADLDSLDFTSPSASGNSTSYIDTVSQENGKITATKKTIPSASTSMTGIVKLNNTLTSTSTTEALTVAQGKVLKSSIDTINSSLKEK